MANNLANSFMKLILNSPLHPLLGARFAVITVEGHKSGKRYSLPINVNPEGAGWTVISMRERTWWRNLRGGQPATLQLAGRQRMVRGEVLEAPPDVAHGLAGLFARFPGHAKYFGIRPAADGSLPAADLERLAQKHVVIHLMEAERV